jgi:hypothetical protein
METSHIWLANFPSEDYVDSYFEEQFDDDDAPINQFAADQGEQSYDHDWVERSFNDQRNLRLLISDHSYSSDYLDHVISRAAEMGIKTANTFIMADVNEFPSPRSPKADDYQIWYIGKYGCNI